MEDQLSFRCTEHSHATVTARLPASFCRRFSIAATARLAAGHDWWHVCTRAISTHLRGGSRAGVSCRTGRCNSCLSQLSQTPVILDIDEDYFGVQGPLDSEFGLGGIPDEPQRALERALKNLHVNSVADEFKINQALRQEVGCLSILFCGARICAWSCSYSTASFSRSKTCGKRAGEASRANRNAQSTSAQRNFRCS